MNDSDNNQRDHEGANKAEGGLETGETLWGRCYEICIGAKLDASWSEWFEGLEMQPFGEKWTKLCGRVADQAALLGILNKLCRLNLPLVSVNEIRGKPECKVERAGGIMDRASRLQRKLKLAGYLLILGLAVEGITLQWAHCNEFFALYPGGRRSRLRWNSALPDRHCHRLTGPSSARDPKMPGSRRCITSRDGHNLCRCA